MPLVFVHGVATRPSDEYAAMVAQRDALFRSLVFKSNAVAILNPDWGSFGVEFGADLPWLPNPDAIDVFSAGGSDPGLAIGPSDLEGRLALGSIAARDAEQAIDLVAMASLDEAIREAARLGTPQAAASPQAIELAEVVGDYLQTKDRTRDTAATGQPDGIAALATADNSAFADALAAELKFPDTGPEAYGTGDRIRGAMGYLTRLIGNGASDLVLKAVRRDLSRSVSLFLGDIFVYLRGRDLDGAKGTRERIFKPVISALAEGAKAPRSPGEPFIVVGHSLGGVILYDILTDASARTDLEAAIGGAIEIDALFTVGSQPGFFADLGLYPGGRPAGGTKLPMPVGVESWMNVFDFTDVFSFRCAHIFEEVQDFGYDTITDLLQAHGAYFLRPSFYKRIRARLKELNKI